MLRTRGRAGPLLLACSIIILALLYRLHASSPQEALITPNSFPEGCDTTAKHPIESLITLAAHRFDGLVEQQTNSLEQATAAYRRKRARHPPPGFDDWHRYATSHKSVVIESFFDQIYSDLEPFWGLQPASIRNSIADWSELLQIRNGQIVQVPNDFFRTKIWTEMISKVVKFLPDMDIALNHLDEPRSLAPQHVHHEVLTTARKSHERYLQPAAGNFSSNIRTMKYLRGQQSQTNWITDKHELQRAIRDRCLPQSALAAKLIPWTPDSPNTAHSQAQATQSYVQDFPETKNVCANPQFTQQHGDLVEPATIHVTRSLLPIFTGSKLPFYHDIVIPEPSYYSTQEHFTGKSFWIDWSTYYPWRSKIHGLVWRGGATGGAAHDDNWQYLHRHRLISRLNASETDTEAAGDRPQDGHFKRWLRSVTDVGFTRLFCNDERNAEHCPEIASHYTLQKPIKMASQYQWKYLPDTDGNSISERFRAFLLSNSAPIKATIFDDWQDHRLIPWRHYIPMQISYNDLYDIMAYFLGRQKVCAHDAAGEKIAHDGRVWSEKVLRREDMVIYLYRTLLEYGGIVNDDRDWLGYVDDLL